MPAHPTDIASLRAFYSRQSLSETEAGNDPIALFGKWFREALEAGVNEANACTLATVGPDGQPSARVVLLKGADENGFVIYTNTRSRKGSELLANPKAALVFWWPELERQLRVEGTAVLVDDDEADAYFASRPHESQLGAWASEQSSIVADREELEKQLDQIRSRFEDGDIPRPEHWSGFRIRPEILEFWQGRPGRLHDRLVFRREHDVWQRNRLAP